MDADPNSLLPSENERIIELQKQLGIEDRVTQYIFLSVESDNPYTLQKLSLLERVIKEIEALPAVENSLTPFNFVSFTSQGSRIVPTTMAPEGTAPDTREELETFRRQITEDPLARNFVVSDNGTVLSTVFTNSRVDDHTVFMDTFRRIIAPLEEEFTVHVTGEVPVGERTTFYLTRDLMVLLLLALLMMLIIFYLSFKAKRSILLPISVVVIGAIWSVGFMSLMGFKLTVVSIIIPSLILTIGSSYTIHILNEYYRHTSDAQEEDHTWIIEAVSHVTRTVLLSALTTIIGFSSLLVTSMEPVREFGVGVSFGIASCAILSLFFLPAVFDLLKPPRKKHQWVVHRGWLIKVIVRVGTFASRFRFLFLGLFAGLVALFFIAMPHIEHQSNYLSYFPQNDRVIKDTKFIIQHTGGSQSLNITLKAPKGEENYFLRTDVLAQVDKLERALANNEDVLSILSFTRILKNMNRVMNQKYAIPENRGLTLLLSRYFRMISKSRFSLGSQASLISEDYRTMTIFTKVYDSTTKQYVTEDHLRALLEEVKQDTDRLLSDEIATFNWGNSLLFLDATRTLNHDQLLSTSLSILLVFIVTAIFFGSVLYGLVALIPLLSGILFYFISLAVFQIPLDMTTILVTNVAIGVGIDDAIHFILQYTRQRKMGRGLLSKSLYFSLKITGRPIVLTTFSLVAGLLVLSFASFQPIIYFGVLVAITLFAAMLGTIVFLPAVLAIVDGRASARRTGRSGKE
jgi:hypothetical protein